MSILVTGGAGFIGSSLVDMLLAAGHEVINVDNFDPFYPRATKERNMAGHSAYASYSFIEADVNEQERLFRELKDRKVDTIFHLAAKAGVRPSIEAPLAYEKANVQGTLNMLELANRLGVKKFIFASSSSVYGKNPNVPWKETDLDLMPISPYAATKIAGESMGRVFCDLYNMHFIALRFFTVYGPRQRPDLAIHKFFRQVLAGTPVVLYGDGSTRRDYTYISDILTGLKAALERKTEAGAYEVFNLGNSDTIQLVDLVRHIEKVCGVKAKLVYEAEQAGDVPQTYADVSRAGKQLGFRPDTHITKGLESFYKWLRES